MTDFQQAHKQDSSHSFLLALKEEKSIGEAAAIAFGQHPAFDLEANLAGLIARGAIIGVTQRHV